jgi:hypothetical protein
MKKLMLILSIALVATSAVARPHGKAPHGPRGGHRPPPPHFRPHHAHRHHGRSAFVSGFVGGVVGGVLTDAVFGPRSTVVVQPAPTVVTTPTVVTAPTVVAPAVSTVQTVWVEGRYVDQVLPDGKTVRVWQPGHYEQQTVVR